MDSKNISDVLCPSCGAPARFDIIHQQYRCAHCDGKVEVKDALKEKQGFRKLQQAKIKKEASKYKLYSASCSGCGATVVFEENESMATCAFCGKALVRKEYVNDKEFPELIIPFRITEDEAKKIAKDWCDSNKSKIEAQHLSEKIPEIKGFYLPYELIRGSVSCDASRKDSTGHYECRGNVDKEFINRSQQLDNLLLDAMEPFELSDLAEFDFGYAAGQRIKTSDVSGSELNSRIRDEISTNYNPEIKKTLHTKALNILVDTESLLRMPVLLPVYYVCGDNLMAAINGQTGKVSVRAEKDSYYYFLPWWLKAILWSLVVGVAVYFIMLACGASSDNALYVDYFLVPVILIISLCAYDDSYKKAFKESAGRKIFTSKGGPYRRTDSGLVKDRKELKRIIEPPVFFYKINGKMQPVVLSFFWPLLGMIFGGFIVAFLPVILALLFNGFNFQNISYSGSAVWFFLFVPLVPAYILKFGIIQLYENPNIYQITESGFTKRYKENSSKIKKSDILDGIKLAFEPPFCFVVGFILLSLFMSVYLTGFNVEEEVEKDKAKVKATQASVEDLKEKTAKLTKTMQANKVETNSDSKSNAEVAGNQKQSDNTVSKSENNSEKADEKAAKPIGNVLPLKQNNVIIRNAKTQEFFNFYGNLEKGYYSVMHFTADKKNDWYVWSKSINANTTAYVFSKKGGKEWYIEAYVCSEDSGFQVLDSNKNLIWTVERSNDEFLLKKGKDANLAYRMYKNKYKSESNNVFIIENHEKKRRGFTLKGNILVVRDSIVDETVYNVTDSKLNKDNELALAFPNIFLLDEMDIKIRCIIALELSQLE